MDWDKIEFKGDKRFLSNMYTCTIKFEANEGIRVLFPNVEFDGETYGSSEHIYMAMKSKNKDWHKIIRDTEEPRNTKNLNKKHIKKDILFDTDTEFRLREDWDEVKIEIMSAIVLLKFIQNPDIAKKLMAIEGDIEERNDWKDVFWGTVDGVGENYLGRILMRVRKYLLTLNEYLN